MQKFWGHREMQRDGVGAQLEERELGEHSVVRLRATPQEREQNKIDSTS